METILKNIMDEFINSDEHFCSEADFQFSLAWRIKEELEKNNKKDIKVLLEYPIKKEEQKKDNKKEENIYIDIYVSYDKKEHFIELKYKTKKAKIKRHENEFTLKNQAAQDIGRYLFCKDIERLENMKNKGNNYAIFLTNDSTYLSQPNYKKDTLDKNFRIHEGSTLNRKLEWIPPEDNDDNKKPHWTTRYDPISLKNNYECKWKTNAINNNTIKSYLLLEIKSNNDRN